MFLSTSEEMLVFLRAQGIAVLLCLLYDFLKSLTPKKLKGAIADFFDAFLCFLAGLGFLIFWQKFLFGEFRWYTVLAFLITNILYYLTIHKPIFTACCIIVKKIYSFFNIIFKFLLTVWVFLVKIIMCVFGICKKIYSVDYEGTCYEKNQSKN